jgi:predicted DNA repair protein MutK
MPGHISNGSNRLAGSSLFALLDDIATLLDDVSVLSKVAAKKTAGVLGDDLALNAEQVSGIRAKRELPVVWAVFKGSAVNKAIMVPIALLLSAFAPWTIMPLLMLGGGYLCFEGFEKVVHRYLHAPDEVEEHKQRLKAVADKNVDMVAFEKRRIRGAIRTDAILSAEIIVIVLGTVQEADLITRIAVLTFLAAAITVGVYGLVAGIVKLDDAGLYLIEKRDSTRLASFQRWLGAWILRAAPKFMTTLSIVGTAAMFLVGGGILVHGLPIVAEGLHHVEVWAHNLPMAGGFFGVVGPLLYNGLFGVAAGGVIVGAYLGVKRLMPNRTAAH